MLIAKKLMIPSSDEVRIEAVQTLIRRMEQQSGHFH